MKRIICKTKNKVFFLENGFLCSGEKGKRSFVKGSTIVKHGRVEEEFMKGGLK